MNPTGPGSTVIIFFFKTFNVCVIIKQKGGVTASTGVNEVKGCMPRILSASLKRQKKHKRKRHRIHLSCLVS